MLLLKYISAVGQAMLEWFSLTLNDGQKQLLKEKC